MKPVAHWLHPCESGSVPRLTGGAGHETPCLRRPLAARPAAAAAAAPAPLSLPRPQAPGLPPVLTGIPFVLQTGSAWDGLPAERGCGCGKTGTTYRRRGYRAGVGQRLHAVLLAELHGADRIDGQRAVLDASFAEAPEGGADTGPDPTDRGKSGSKHHVLTDAPGVLLAATVTAANVNEVLPSPVRVGPSPAGPPGAAGDCLARPKSGILGA